MSGRERETARPWWSENRHTKTEEEETHGTQAKGTPNKSIRDVVDFASSSNVPVAILSLDQEKAFDRVDWNFMLSTLRTMGFGPSFVAWVELFYTRVRSTVNVNGNLTDFSFLPRGVRQDCPLSPLLYVLTAEVFTANLRANPCIRGLALPGAGSIWPIAQYADDTSLILSSDGAIKAAFEAFTKFEKASGSKLNLAKSKGLWLGRWWGRTDPQSLSTGHLLS